MEFDSSPIGWGYLLEGKTVCNRIIDKGRFEWVGKQLTECRKKGLLPLDFVVADEGRASSGVEIPNINTIPEQMVKVLSGIKELERFYYTPDWWKDETYYIQVLVEKIDLVGLFGPVCQKYHIPIASTGGRTDVSQRAEYGRRFKEAEEKGLKCILLYCGDFDPPGLAISEELSENFEDMKFGHWKDGTPGYEPQNLIIKRFGLNYDFIIQNNLSWIDGLITSNNKNLADPSHPQHNYYCVPEWLSEIGNRKCEANALVVRPKEGRQLAEDTILYYLGVNAEKRFKAKEQLIIDEVQTIKNKIDLDESIQKIIEQIE